MVLLKDFTFPESSRLLQLSPGRTTRDSTSDDSGDHRPLNQVAIIVAGVGLLLLFAIWVLSCARSGLATRGVVNVTSATAPPQDERAGDAIQSTLQRKHAILELFRASHVTMKVTDADINGADTKDRCNEDIESGVAGGTLTLSRAAATSSNNAAPQVSFSAPPPWTVPNCCAICLESYQPGELVARSSSCVHVFHQDCIARYLSTKLIGKETPCPSCRQKFCYLPEAQLEPTTSLHDSDEALSEPT